jgi:hypothetical protein
MEKLSVTDLYSVDEKALEIFFNECKRLGYVNNISHESIKTDFVKERDGNIWFLSNNDRIISMAGCHRFDEIAPTAFRILYRGCDLPGTDVKKTLSRSHFNSICFRELVPLQIKWISKNGYDTNNLYLTVNKGHKNHRAMCLIEKQGFLERIGDMNIFYTDQTVWKFNTKHYESVRRSIKTYVV